MREPTESTIDYRSNRSLCVPAHCHRSQICSPEAEAESPKSHRMAAEAAFRGFIETTLDALLIFEGCRRGFLPKITRRLQESEKRALVVSGAVFVFDEEETGIKRWTDGLSWSPSRTLGNFLIYRELDKKAASGNAGGSGSAAGTANEGNDDAVCDDALEDVKPNDMAAGPSSSSSRHPSASTSRRESLTDTTGATPPLDRARERALVGSLTSTYRFRSDGLVKKTISLSGLHMIGYYRIEDVTSGRLRTPSSHSELISLQVSSDFLSPTLFRVPPVVEVGVDGQLHYKGESDMPVSPLQRSLSSQDFPNQTVSLAILSFLSFIDHDLPCRSALDHHRLSLPGELPRLAFLKCRSIIQMHGMSLQRHHLDAAAPHPFAPLATASSLTAFLAPRLQPRTSRLARAMTIVTRNMIRRHRRKVASPCCQVWTARIAATTERTCHRRSMACSARLHHKSTGVNQRLRLHTRLNI